MLTPAKTLTLIKQYEKKFGKLPDFFHEELQSVMRREESSPKMVPVDDDRPDIFRPGVDDFEDESEDEDVSQFL